MRRWSLSPPRRGRTHSRYSPSWTTTVSPAWASSAARLMVPKGPLRRPLGGVGTGGRDMEHGCHGCQSVGEGGGNCRGHFPIVPFILVIHCSDVMDSRNSLAMLSSSVSATVGDNAWSQDWAKFLAFDVTS